MTVKKAKIILILLQSQFLFYRPTQSSEDHYKSLGYTVIAVDIIKLLRQTISRSTLLGFQLHSQWIPFHF